MKIAFIHNLPEGGGKRMINTIMNRYSSMCEIDLYIIGTGDIQNIPRVKTHFFKVNPWKGFLPHNVWILFILPFIHKKIANNIDWSKYDIVFFTHDYFTKSPYLLKYIKNSNKYYLCQESQREFYEPSTYHAPTIKDKIIKIFRYPIKLVDQHNVKHATVLFCNSKFSKKTLENIYGRKFKIVYPGVNEKYFSPSNIKKENQFICVGGINKIKNQEFIINSITPLLDKNSLILIGNGRTEYVNNIKSLNKNIKVISNITDSSLRNLYRKSKITFVGAFREPFGLSSIESQACGTPVMMVNDGGSVETIIDGKTGYSSNLNYEEFYAKTKKILSNEREMGINARKNVLDNWTIEKTLEPLDKYILK